MLWFSTPNDYGRFLCHKRGDAFLFAPFLYAMRRGMHVKVEAPLSECLFYLFIIHFILIITTIFPHHYLVKVNCPLDDGHLNYAGVLRVGFSCGVDSMYTALRHTREDCSQSRGLTQLAFFDIGASGDLQSQRDPENELRRHLNLLQRGHGASTE